jgi:hypothetical protein
VPFQLIRVGKNRGKYRSPSGHVLTSAQVRAYYAKKNSSAFDAPREITGRFASPRGVTHGAERWRRRTGGVTDTTFQCDAVGPNADPTGTFDLRRRYMAEFMRRWAAVTRAARAVLIDQDILGLNPGSAGAVALAHSVRQRPAAIGSGSLASLGSDAKVRAFQSWIDQTMAQLVLERDGAWLRPMLAKPYDRAVARGMRLTKKQVMPEEASNRIDALTSLAIVEVQGVMEAVSQQSVRAVAQGLLQNDKAPQIMRSIADRISTLGVVRCNALVATLVIKAFTTGTVDQFRAASVLRVGVIPETLPIKRKQTDSLFSRDAGSGPVSRGGTSASTIRRAQAVETTLRATVGEYVNIETAGDAEVCPECDDLSAGGPYDLNTALSLIPAHPNCRCAYVPAEDTVTAE